jgi:glutamyl-tRNA synthetase
VNDLADQLSFLVDEKNFEISDAEWARAVATQRAQEVLDIAIAHVERCEWTVEALNFVTELKDAGLKPAKAMPAIYVAIEGRSRGLPAFEAMYVLGRERTLARLRAARRRLDDGLDQAGSGTPD